MTAFPGSGSLQLHDLPSPQWWPGAKPTGQPLPPGALAALGELCLEQLPHWEPWCRQALPVWEPWCRQAWPSPALHWVLPGHRPPPLPGSLLMRRAEGAGISSVSQCGQSMANRSLMEAWSRIPASPSPLPPRLPLVQQH